MRGKTWCDLPEKAEAASFGVPGRAAEGPNDLYREYDRNRARPRKFLKQHENEKIDKQLARHHRDRLDGQARDALD